jgi:hypothetical protein
MVLKDEAVLYARLKRGSVELFRGGLRHHLLRKKAAGLRGPACGRQAPPLRYWCLLVEAGK